MRLGKLNRGMIRFFDVMMKFRWMVITFFTILAILLVLTVRPHISNNSELLWLEGSPLYEKLLQSKAQAQYVYQLKFTIDGMSEQKLSELYKINKTLSATQGIKEIHGIFTVPVGVLRSGELSESKLFTFTTLNDVAENERLGLIRTNRHYFLPYINEHSVSFYLLTQSHQNFFIPKTSLEYELIEPLSNETPVINWIILLLLFTVFFVAMKLIFKTWIAPVIMSIYITMLGIISLSLFDMMSLHNYEHMAIVMIALVMALMNILYLYYKWHIYQRQMSPHKALKYALNRTLIPQGMTTFILLAALMPLMVLNDSEVLFSLALFTSISLLVSLILSLSFAPALLSLFHVKNSSLAGLGIFNKFAGRICTMHSSLFGAILLFLVVGVSILSVSILEQKIEHRPVQMITVGFNAEGINKQTLKKIVQIEQRLVKQDQINSIESFATYLRYIYPQSNSTSYEYNKASIAGATFYLDLFGLREVLFNNEKPLVRIYLNDNADAQKIVSVLKGLSFSDELLFYDVSSQVDAAKLDAFRILAIIGFLLLVLVAFMVAILGKNLLLSLSVLFMNVLPVGLFMGIAWLIHFPVDMALLVALLLGIAIASDAELHQFYNTYADGERLDDDVVGMNQERFHTAASNVFVHSILVMILFSLALCIDGFIGMTSLYLGIILFLSTLIDLYMMPKLFNEYYHSSS